MVYFYNEKSNALKIVDIHTTFVKTNRFTVFSLTKASENRLFL